MKILNKKNLAETRFLNLVDTTYEDKNGKQRSWVSAERPGNQNAVVIVAVVPCWSPRHSSLGSTFYKLVLIKEFRIPLMGYEIGLPAGLIDPGMSIEDTAVKELKEETGLDVVKFLRPVTPFIFNSPGITSEAISYAFVEAKGNLSNEYLESSEDITAFLYDQSSVQQLLADATDPENGIMIGAKSWLIFDRFVKYGDI